MLHGSPAWRIPRSLGKEVGNLAGGAGSNDHPHSTWCHKMRRVAVPVLIFQVFACGCSGEPSAAKSRPDTAMKDAGMKPGPTLEPGPNQKIAPTESLAYRIEGLGGKVERTKDPKQAI